MYKLGLEKAEEPEIKLSTFIGSQRKQGNSRETSTSVSLTMLKSLYGSQQTMENSQRWEYQTTRYPDAQTTRHSGCLLRNLYAGQNATARTVHGTMNWFKIGKGVHQCCILSPCLFNFYAEYIMRNSRLDESQAGIKIARRISTTSDMQMIPVQWQKVKRN